MIPYDDLVAALASWRHRQGLPTGLIPTAAVAPAPVAQAAAPPAGRPAGRPATAPGGRPATAPGGRPATAAGPAPAARPPAAVIVDPGQEESLELFEEGGFDGDFAMSFSDEPAESTAPGAPPPSSAGARSPRRGGR
jgi:hypothetical protein